MELSDIILKTLDPREFLEEIEIRHCPVCDQDTVVNASLRCCVCGYDHYGNVVDND